MSVASTYFDKTVLADEEAADAGGRDYNRLPYSHRVRRLIAERGRIDCDYCCDSGPEPGWLWTDNNGPIVSCPICNKNGKRDLRIGRISFKSAGAKRELYELDGDGAGDE